MVVSYKMCTFAAEQLYVYDMNTTAVHIDTQLYNNVAEYAKKQHVSVDKMLEGYLMLLSYETSERKLRGVAYQELIRRLSDFQEYEEGWDGEGARPLSNSVVKNFKQVLENADDQLLEGWTIFPAANGSLLMEYKPCSAGINIGKSDFSYYQQKDGILNGKNKLSFSVNGVIDTMQLISHDR